MKMQTLIDRAKSAVPTSIVPKFLRRQIVREWKSTMQVGDGLGNGLIVAPLKPTPKMIAASLSVLRRGRDAADKAHPWVSSKEKHRRRLVAALNAAKAR